MNLQEFLTVVSLAWFAQRNPVSKEQAKEICKDSSIEKVLKSLKNASTEERALKLSAVVLVTNKGGSWGDVKKQIVPEWQAALVAYKDTEFKQCLERLMRVSKRWPETWVKGFSEVAGYLDCLDYSKMTFEPKFLEMETLPAHGKFLVWLMVKYQHDDKGKCKVVQKVWLPHRQRVIESLKTVADFRSALGYINLVDGLKQQLKAKFIERGLRCQLSNFTTATFICSFLKDDYVSFDRCSEEEKKELLQWVSLGDTKFDLSEELLEELGRTSRLTELPSLKHYYCPAFERGFTSGIAERSISDESRKEFIRTLKICADKGTVFHCLRFAYPVIAGHPDVPGELNLLVAFCQALSAKSLDSIDVPRVDKDHLKMWFRFWREPVQKELIAHNILYYSFLNRGKSLPMKWRMFSRPEKMFDLDQVCEADRPIAALQNLLFGDWTRDGERKLVEVIAGVSEEMSPFLENFLDVLSRREKPWKLRGIAEAVWENETFRAFVVGRGSLKDLLEEKNARKQTDDDIEEMKAGVKRKMEEPFLQQVKKQCPEHLPALKKGLQLELLIANPVYTCPVCMDGYSVRSGFLRQPQCGHVFCADCVRNMLPNCAICRGKIVSTSPPISLQPFEMQ